ncbi:glycosyltransferase family 4 protein [Methanoculleus sp.]|uniref:glycosyltransferase family 4 protein n=1 Tax=Methanoculleus sp. TaxID=90427 RepID=UPI0025E78947|nr:glycosyltransferase family 4 protein [Methanoculleus sp.]
MKILRVAGDLYPAFVGGIAIHAHEMSKMQASFGNEVTVYTSVWDDELPEETRDRYRIIRFRGVTVFRNSIALALFRRLLRERKMYDIIHAHSHLYFSTVLCALARMAGSSPLVVTNHGLISQTAPMWLQKTYIPTIGRWIYNVADGIVCYTETERDQLVDLGIRPDRITVIHNGVDTDHFAPSPDGSPEKQILWIGKYVPGKGVEYLLRGFQLFSRDFPDYTLLMIGRGPLKDDSLRMIEDLGLTGKVILKDFVQNKDLPDVYRQSSLFVLPSLEEGVPRTILEAMACGVPVACTELPQLVDIVSGCGLLFPLRDPEALAAALSTLASDPDMARTCGTTGRERTVSRYSWNDTVRKTLDLYASLTGKCAVYGSPESDGGCPEDEASRAAGATNVGGMV